MYIAQLKNHLMVDEIIEHNLIQYCKQLLMIYHQGKLDLDDHLEWWAKVIADPEIRDKI